MSLKTNRYPRFWIGIATSLALICVLIITQFSHESSDQPLVDVEMAEDSTSFNLAWPIGERQIYRLQYNSQDSAQPFVDAGMGAASSEPMSASLQLVARVAVTGEGPGAIPGSSRVRFEFEACDEASWKAAGAEIWRNANDCNEMLDGAALGAEVAQTGRVLEVFDPPEASSAVQSLLQTLWLAMQAELPAADHELDDEGYRRESETMHGTAKHLYLTQGVNPLVLERRTETYFDLRIAKGLAERPEVQAGGSTRFEFGDDGTLRRLGGEERLSVATAAGLEILSSNVSIDLVWQGREQTNIAKTSGQQGLEQWSRRSPGSIPTSANIQAQLLDQRVGDLDESILLGRLRNLGLIGVEEDAARFIWQATGLLEQQPELSWKLLPFALGEGVSVAQRALAIDLLVSTGHDTAQAVLRKALGDPGVLLNSDVAMRHLYQRFGMLEQPNAQTAQMVADHYSTFQAGNNRSAELSSAYSLGAIVHRLSNASVEERQLAKSYNDLLVSALWRSEGAEILSHRVAALGNTRRKENVVIFSDFAEHQSGQVRRRVAAALGKIESTDPPHALLQLIADTDGVVQRTAIRSARPHAEVYAEIVDAAEQGNLSALNHRAVLDLVKGGRTTHRPETDQVLDVLLARGIEDDQNRELAYQLKEL